MKKTEIPPEEVVAPDGIIVIDRDKKIIAFNEAAQRITGFAEKEIIFRDYQFLFKDTPSENSFTEDALTKGQSFSNLSVNLVNADGQKFNVLASITPLKPPGKPIVGIVFVFRNTQEMAYLTQSLREKSLEILNERNRLQAIFNSRLEGTFTIDKNWIITSFNVSAERVTGYSAKEAVGKRCWEIFQSKVCRNGCHMECTMRDRQSTDNHELQIIRKDGRRVPVRVNSAPMFDANGVHIGGVETFQNITEIKNLTTHLEERYRFEKIIGRSKSMQKIYELIDNVCHTDSTVLITGESGTGKELVARAIHLNSERKPGPFMVLNCSAFVETLMESELFGHEKGAFTGAIRSKPGRFELAHNGTLFLDEIGDISPAVQVKLLRVLETRQFERVGGTKSIKVDVRIIAATNKNMEDEVASGRFREDLYYRLNVINIHLPPLRDRMEDIPLLVEHFMEKFRRKFNKSIREIAPAAFRMIQNYDWPGNIRSLENALEHAFVLCHDAVIHPECLPERLWDKQLKTQLLVEPVAGDDPVQRAEKTHIENTLNQFHGHRGKAADALGVDKSTLWRKMKKYGLS
ncbi:MAG: sigma 54-interacting transcriptional regulator [Calditrichia bacterium]